MRHDQFAFELFLRRGIRLDALEADYKTDADFQAANPAKETRDHHSPPYYVWRTSGDDRVRASHAVNNGQIFSWDIPPATGHPGEDFSCRCWAEPYNGISDFINSKLIKPIINRVQNYLVEKPKWNNLDMSLHFYTGNGSGVTLNRIGHLEDIKAYYEANYLGRFENQIRKKAETLRDGSFKVKFEQVYNFYDVLFSYRKATMNGRFEGEVMTLPSGERVIEGNAQIQFIDWFSDPLEVRQTFQTINNRLSFERIHDKNFHSFVQLISEVGGKPYPILEKWDKKIRIAVSP